MIRSSCRAIAGDDITAALLYQRAATVKTPAVNQRRLDFIADMTTLLVAADRDEMSCAAARAEAALTDRDAVAPRVYACALFVLGWADSRLRRGPARGSALLEAAIHECTALGLPEVAHRARQNLAFALAHAGDFCRAEQALHLAVEAGGSTPSCGCRMTATVSTGSPPGTSASGVAKSTWQSVISPLLMQPRASDIPTPLGCSWHSAPRRFATVRC
ncbi:hypothetical protein LT337_07140 [Mycolicibacterium fortuitum]|nr:hypothetical protein LT337_07140 [Mycolicibacterium fortuitum]